MPVNPDVEVGHLCERHPPESQIRQTLARAGVMAVRLIGPPGSGKTELIRAILARISSPQRVAVIVVNPAASRDAANLLPQCANVQWIEAAVSRPGDIRQAIQKLPLKDLDLIFIETCGGLAAIEDLGQDATIATLAVTGGDDKAVEYSAMIKHAAAVVLTNVDLRYVVKFDERVFRRDVQSINNTADIFEVSSTTGAGIFPLLMWLESKRDKMRIHDSVAPGSDLKNDNFIG